MAAGDGTALFVKYVVVDRRYCTNFQQVFCSLFQLNDIVQVSLAPMGKAYFKAKKIPNSQISCCATKKIGTIIRSTTPLMALGEAF